MGSRVGRFLCSRADTEFVGALQRVARPRLCYSPRMKSDILDILGHAADIVGLIGIPTLVVATYTLYRDFRESRKPKIVSDQCLEFYDESLRCGINLVPLHTVTAVPRAGDTVYLPGEDGPDNKNYGGGVYQVTSIDFSYHPAPEVDQPCPAIPAKIVVRVKKFEKASQRT